MKQLFCLWGVICIACLVYRALFILKSFLPVFPVLYYTTNLAHLFILQYPCHVLDCFIYERKPWASRVDNIELDVSFARRMCCAEKRVAVSYCRFIVQLQPTPQRLWRAMRSWAKPPLKTLLKYTKVCDPWAWTLTLSSLTEFSLIVGAQATVRPAHIGLQWIPIGLKICKLHLDSSLSWVFTTYNIKIDQFNKISLNWFRKVITWFTWHVNVLYWVYLWLKSLCVITMPLLPPGNSNLQHQTSLSRQSRFASACCSCISFPLYYYQFK